MSENKRSIIKPFAIKAIKIKPVADKEAKECEELKTLINRYFKTIKVEKYDNYLVYCFDSSYDGKFAVDWYGFSDDWFELELCNTKEDFLKETDY